MRLAIEKAEATGIGMVSVRNSTHYGPASPYALMALGHSMIGISLTTGGNGVVLPGGAQRVMGSTPCHSLRRHDRPRRRSAWIWPRPSSPPASWRSRAAAARRSP
jgi:hypothetical protein